MPAFLHLPPELEYHINLLTTDQINKLIPSQHEITQLGIKDLAMQLVNNTLNHYDTYETIPSNVDKNLRVWMLVAEDDRLDELISTPQSTYDNVWKMTALQIKNIKNLIGTEFNEMLNTINFAKEDDHPYFSQCTNLLDDFINISGDVSNFVDLCRGMLTDHKFINSNLIEITIILVTYIGPISTHPDETYELIDDFATYLELHGMNYLSAKINQVLGSIHMNAGRYEDALAYYENVEEFATQHNYKFDKISRNNKGIIFFYTGKWDQAIELFSKMLEDEPDNPTYLNNLADAYSRKGMYEEAWIYAEQFLELSNMRIIMAYEFVQPILFELGLDQRAKQLIDEMQEIAKTADIPMNKAALLLMEARQARYDLNMGTAQQKIDAAIEMSMEWKNLPLIFFMLIEKIYIHLDLYELKSTDNNRQRLFNAVDTLIQLSDEQGVAVGSIQGLSLRSQVYQLCDQMTEARKDLYNAAKLAKEFEYTNLYEQLNQELTDLQEVDHIDEQESKSIFGKIKEKLRNLTGLQSESDYKEQQYITHGVILMSSTGMPLYTDYLTDLLQSDSALISGLISAVSSMLNEFTQKHGFLKKIQRDDLSLLFEPIRGHLLVSIVSQDTFDARQRLQHLSNSTEDLLVEFDIDEMTSQIPRDFDTAMNSAVNQNLLN